MHKAFCFFLLIIGISFAQPSIEWQKSLGGSDDDWGYFIAQTNDSGYLVVGYSYSNDGDVHGHHSDTLWTDYWIVRLDSSGDTLWTKSLGGLYLDWGTCGEQTNDGGYIIAGHSRTYRHGSPYNSDYWLVKLDSSGDTVWTRNFGGWKGDYCFSVQQTFDGGYILAGFSYSDSGDVRDHHGDTSHCDIWLVKLDSTGDTVWTKSLGGTLNEKAYSIQQTADSGYIVAGLAYSNNGDVSGHHGDSLHCDVWVVKLDAEGDIEWQKSLGGSGTDAAYSIKQTFDGGYIVAGYSYSNDGDVGKNYGSADFWIVKLDSSGDTVWTGNFGGSRKDVAHSVWQTLDSGYIVAGYSFSNDSDVTGHHSGPPGSLNSPDVWVIKLSSSGTLEWQKSLGGSKSEDAWCVQQTFDSGYVIAGFSYSNNGDVSGHHGDSLHMDYWVVKLDAYALKIEESPPQPANAFIKVYPNPFNSACKIFVPEQADISIYDFKGKLVLRKSKYKGLFIWSPEIASGLYFITAKTKKGKFKQKLFYLK